MSPRLRLAVPGAAFFAASLVFLIALVLAARWFGMVPTPARASPT